MSSAHRIWRAAGYTLPPWTILNKTKGSTVLLPSYIEDVMAFLSASLNFTFLICSPILGGHGTKKADGTFSGVIGALQRNEADIGLLPFGPTYERSTAVELSMPFWYSSITVLSKSPKPVKDPFAFISVFDIQVWMLIIFSLLLVSWTLYYEYRLSHYKKKMSKKLDFPYVSLSVYSTLCTQGMNLPLQSARESFILLLWLLYSFQIMQFTSCLLISRYSSVQEKGIDTLQDVVDNGKIRPITQENSVIQEYLQNSTLSVRKEVFKMVIERNGLLSTTEMFSDKSAEEILKGESLIIMEAIPLAHFIHRHCYKKRGYYLAQQPIRWQPLGLAIRKGIPKADLENINRQLVIYSGTQQLMQRIKSLELSISDCLWTTSAGQTAALAIQDLVGVVYIFLIGMGASVLTFAFEFIAYHLHEKKLR